MIYILNFIQCIIFNLNYAKQPHLILHNVSNSCPTSSAIILTHRRQLAYQLFKRRRQLGTVATMIEGVGLIYMFFLIETGPG